MATKRSIGSESAPRRSVAVVVCAAVFLLLSVAAALAADPTDVSFGVKGIAEIEAFAHLPEGETQVGGIVDLERDRDGKLLAAVYGIAKGGHYFAATRINPNGTLDKSFGEDGFTVEILSRGDRGGLATGVTTNVDGRTFVAGGVYGIGSKRWPLRPFLADLGDR